MTEPLEQLVREWLVYRLRWDESVSTACFESDAEDLAALLTRTVKLAEAKARLEEAKEWDETAQYHIARWPELEWRRKRIADLRRAVEELEED